MKIINNQIISKFSLVWSYSHRTYLICRNDCHLLEVEMGIIEEIIQDSLENLHTHVVFLVADCDKSVTLSRSEKFQLLNYLEINLTQRWHVWRK